MTNNIWDSEHLDAGLLGGTQAESPQHYHVRETALRRFLEAYVGVEGFDGGVDLLLLQELAAGTPIAKLVQETLSTHALVLPEHGGQAVLYRKSVFSLDSVVERDRFTVAVLKHAVTGHLIVAASVHLPWQGKENERSKGLSTRRPLFATILREVQDTRDALARQQMGSVVSVAAVIGGDMNDPFHPSEVANMAGWRDSFFDVNKLAPATYPSFFGRSAFGQPAAGRGSVTYDWLFLDHGIKAKSSDVIEVVDRESGVSLPPFSDHKPVVSTVEMVQTQG
jgi:hypothetical protein